MKRIQIYLSVEEMKELVKALMVYDGEDSESADRVLSILEEEIARNEE